MEQQSANIQAEVRIQIHTTDQGLASALFGSDPQKGMSLKVADHSVCRYDGTLKSQGAWPGGTQIIQMSVAFVSGVGSKLLASWLYDKWKGRVTEVRIKRKIIELTPEGIQRVLEESVHMKE